jgi:acetyl esterase/lipase
LALPLTPLSSPGVAIARPSSELVTLVALGAVANPALPPKVKAAPVYSSQIAAKLEPTRRVIYKTIGGRELRLDFFEPAWLKPEDRRPAFVTLHGGGWGAGEPRAMYPWAAHCAELGMVGISVQYRLYKAGTAVTVFECVKDARSALRYVRGHALEHGIDPKKIVANGASAGGHLAMATAMFDGVDEAGEDTSVSCAPNALVLFSSVMDTSTEGYGNAKVGPRWRDLSPVHQVRAGLPPTLTFHSTRDTTTPFKGAQLFHEAMMRAGNPSELVVQPDVQHMYMFTDAKLYAYTQRRLDLFLTKLGYLPIAADNHSR